MPLNETGSKRQNIYEEPGGVLVRWLVSVGVPLKPWSEHLVSFAPEVLDTSRLTMTNEGVGSTNGSVAPVGGSRLTSSECETAPQLLQLMSRHSFNEIASEQRDGDEEHGGILVLWLTSIPIGIALKSCSKRLFGFRPEFPDTAQLTMDNEGIGGAKGFTALLSGFRLTGFKIESVP